MSLTKEDFLQIQYYAIREDQADTKAQEINKDMKAFSHRWPYHLQKCQGGSLIFHVTEEDSNEIIYTGKDRLEALEFIHTMLIMEGHI